MQGMRTYIYGWLVNAKKVTVTIFEVFIRAYIFRIIKVMCNRNANKMKKDKKGHSN